jgi:hypothetical protein
MPLLGISCFAAMAKKAQNSAVPVEMLDAPPPVSAALRKKILSDPNTAKLAKEVDMDLETFVNTVGYYMNNPDVEPAFLVVSDEELRKNGYEPPTVAQLQANVRESVAMFEAGSANSGFDKPKKNTLELRAVEVGEKKAKPAKADPVSKASSKPAVKAKAKK